MNVSRASCCIAAVLLGIVCGTSVLAAQAGGANQALPGGANSIQEAHGDWRVACSQQGAQKVCTLSQQIMDRSSRQRILAIELNAPASDHVEGTLILPFGLTLDKGITFQVDELAAGPTLRFRTCLPAGCIVSVRFDAKALAALKTGTALTVKATGDNEQEIPFTISLRGFASAIDRTAALAK
jgi:invasion protein IalB